MIIFIGLVFTQYAFFKPIPDKWFWITGIPALIFSILVIADFMANFITNLIRKYGKANHSDSHHGDDSAGGGDQHDTGDKRGS